LTYRACAEPAFDARHHDFVLRTDVGTDIGLVEQLEPRIPAGS
jgi:hypothetical protein